jgi:APA family basic amino acid/polyamine antiporter
MFLCAKSASAATAALGFSGYLLNALRLQPSPWLAPLAVGVVIVLTVLVLTGIRRSSAVNVAIVGITCAALATFVVGGLPSALRGGHYLSPFFAPVAPHRSLAGGFFEATALMFVAYTGYGRIATLGEEIRRPRRNIPIAITFTLLASMAIYVAVGLVSVAAVGAEAMSAATERQAAPLEAVAQSFRLPGVAMFVAVGAMTAMLGVLLNLLLGLSRVLLAMGRRGDMPTIVARIDRQQTTPYVAVIVIGVLIAVLAAMGSVKTTWSFSAFTVLIYYSLTNLAALRLSQQQRLYPRVIPALGLGACLFLAFWVEAKIWLIGLAMIALGVAWHWMARRFSSR